MMILEGFDISASLGGADPLTPDTSLHAALSNLKWDENPEHELIQIKFCKKNTFVPVVLTNLK